MAVRPEKDSAMLCDIMYMSPDKAQGTCDKLYTIWKDLDTGDKHLIVTDEPSMDIFFTKPEYRTHDYNKNYEHIDKVDKVRVKYRDIPFVVANEMGNKGMDLLSQIKSTKNYARLREVHLHPYAYGTDFDVRAWYRMQWKERYDNDRTKVIDKGYLDIEADGLTHTGMVTPQTCPINAVTLINDKTRESFTFLLMTPTEFSLNIKNKTEKDIRYEQYINSLYDKQREDQQYMIDHMSEFVQELHDLFDETYGWIDYNIMFYNDERKMLVHMWQLINIWKLDMIGIWNMPFDIPYILERMEYLGLDPTEYVCHPDFPVKRCYFKKDTRNFLKTVKAVLFSQEITIAFGNALTAVTW